MQNEKSLYTISGNQYILKTMSQNDFEICFNFNTMKYPPLFTPLGIYVLQTVLTHSSTCSSADTATSKNRILSQQEMTFPEVNELY